MTCYLPPQMLKIFAPRPPLMYLPPPADDKDYSDRLLPNVSPIGPLVKKMRENKEDYKDETPFTLTAEEQKRSKIEEKKHKAIQEKQRQLKEYDPQSSEGKTGNPFNTLFVARLNKTVDEEKLKKFFGPFGPLRVKLIRNKKSNESRGYAFVEYENEKDMKRAYREMDGVKIDNMRILVDVERARTIKNWMPRRLGGGLGGSHVLSRLRFQDQLEEDRIRNQENERANKRARY